MQRIVFLFFLSFPLFASSSKSDADTDSTVPEEIKIWVTMEQKSDSNNPQFDQRKCKKNRKNRGLNKYPVNLMLELKEQIAGLRKDMENFRQDLKEIFISITQENDIYAASSSSSGSNSNPDSLTNFEKIIKAMETLDSKL